MTKTIPFRLRWLWFKQWPLWLLTGNSTAFHNARVTYAHEVSKWLKL